MTHVTEENPQPASLTDAWCDLLRSYPWQDYVTLTFSPDRWKKVHPKFAFSRVRVWASRLRTPVAWFGVAEPTQPDFHHLHLLLEGAGHLPNRSLGNVWKKQGGGHAKIREYDPDRAACEYLARKAVDPDVVWDCSESLRQLPRSA